MADPHVVLAPIVEPVLLLPPAPPAAGLSAALAVGAGLALLLLLVALGWAVRRAAPRIALRRIARLPDPQRAAHALAQWQQRHWPQAPARWRDALERLRFGVACADAQALVQDLCAQAAQAGRSR